MKKIYLLGLICTSSLIGSAQVFWTEDFGTGCNRGQLASAYSGTNGAWAIGSSGTNDAYANTFFVGAQADGNAVGACGSACTGVDASLHVSNIALVISGFFSVGADTGASYFSGGLGSFGYPAITNRRAESPVINCTGKTSITVAFAYLENGATTLDDASLMYSSDGGTTWALLNNMAKTAVGTCAALGTWTAYSFPLPPSANNNPLVKIGFNWTNNDDGIGTDPSFAVDDITLSSSSSVGIADVNTAALEVFSAGNNIVVKSTDVVKLNGVYDVLGRNIAASLENNTINMEAQPAGIYFVKVEVKGQLYTKKVFIK
jgi:hypothetical protein